MIAPLDTEIADEIEIHCELVSEKVHVPTLYLVLYVEDRILSDGDMSHPRLREVTFQATARFRRYFPMDRERKRAQTCSGGTLKPNSEHFSAAHHILLRGATLYAPQDPAFAAKLCDGTVS